MSRPPRLSRFDYCGRHSYFLTFCTLQRQETLLEPSVAELVRMQIFQSSERFQFAVFAYCIMPDHVHLLVSGRCESSDLRRFVKNLKQSSGQRYARTNRRPLWHDSYYDHVVRPEEDLSSVARYILENPVRAGLAASALDYPYAGSGEWVVEELMHGRLTRRVHGAGF